MITRAADLMLWGGTS